MTVTRSDGPTACACVATLSAPTATAPPAPGGGGDLLPSSPPPTQVDLGDAMAVIYALELTEKRSDDKATAAQVSVDSAAQHKAIQDELAALARAAENSGGSGFFDCIGALIKDFTVDTVEWNADNLAKDMKTDLAACDNPQFWSDLEAGAKWVALAASAVATVFTCGACGPLVVGIALLLSVGGFVVQQTQCFGSASTWVGVGMQLASAALTCGSSLASSAPQLASSTGAIAAAAAGTATATAGAAHVEVAQHQAAAVDADADAMKAKQSAAFLERVERWVLESLQQQNHAVDNALATLTGAIQTNQQASLVAAAPLSRG